MCKTGLGDAEGVSLDEWPPTIGVVEFSEAELAELADEPGGDGVRGFLPEDKVGDVGTEGAEGNLLTEGGERIKKLAMTAKKKQINPRVRMVHGQLTSWKRLRVA